MRDLYQEVLPMHKTGLQGWDPSHTRPQALHLPNAPSLGYDSICTLPFLQRPHDHVIGCYCSTVHISASTRQLLRERAPCLVGQRRHQALGNAFQDRAAVFCNELHQRSALLLGLKATKEHPPPCSTPLLPFHKVRDCLECMDEDLRLTCVGGNRPAAEPLW